MSKLPALMALALLPAISGAAAEKKPAHNDVFTAGPADETQMARQVRHNLLMLPYYSVFDDLSFHVDGSVVTLDGACPPEPPWNIKSDAEAAVKKTPGVTKVINDIKELPLSPMDWQIRRAEAKAIYGNAEIADKYGYQAVPSIHIIVENGHVTLDGVVDNTFDDTLVNTRAKSVPGVFSVDDHLIVLNQGNTQTTHK